MSTFNDPPWVPVTDMVERAHLDKLNEEMHELGKVLSRIGSQGIDGCDPGTGAGNGDELRKEASDVLFTLRMLFEYYRIVWPDNDPEMIERMIRKTEQKRQWHHECSVIQYKRDGGVFDGPAVNGIATIGGMPVAVGVIRTGSAVISGSDKPPVIRSFIYGEPPAEDGAPARDQPQREAGGTRPTRYETGSDRDKDNGR
jgi:hypothetical protein